MYTSLVTNLQVYDKNGEEVGEASDVTVETYGPFHDNSIILWLGVALEGVNARIELSGAERIALIELLKEQA